MKGSFTYLKSKSTISFILWEVSEKNFKSSINKCEFKFMITLTVELISSTQLSRELRWLLYIS